MNVYRMIAVVLWVAGFTVAAAQDLHPPVIENPPEVVSESGYVKLSWGWSHPALDTELLEFELQQSESSNFEKVTTIYKGPDYATFLSGLENGSYYHRVRVISDQKQIQSDWSLPLLVRVQHHSHQLAFALFGIGAIVFFITVGIVIQGSRAANRNP